MLSVFSDASTYSQMLPAFLRCFQLFSNVSRFSQMFPVFCQMFLGFFRCFTYSSSLSHMIPAFLRCVLFFSTVSRFSQMFHRFFPLFSDVSSFSMKNFPLFHEQILTFIIIIVMIYGICLMSPYFIIVLEGATPKNTVFTSSCARANIMEIRNHP